ncbi:MAG: DUF86 domain-containing protein [Planctomycetota bacterium]
MQHKSPKWLEDIRSSATFILQTMEGKSLKKYTSDPVLRAAVERHFEIIGEAMNRIARHDPEIAKRFGDYARIIAFRNLLIHGYDLVEHREVWNVIRDHLPSLRAQVESLLRESHKNEPLA